MKTGGSRKGSRTNQTYNGFEIIESCKRSEKCRKQPKVVLQAAKHFQIN